MTHVVVDLVGDWEDTDEVTAPEQPKEEWVLGREELALFYSYNVSIPPTVHDAVMLMQKLEQGRGR